jgi:arsenite oxidase small subunit
MGTRKKFLNRESDQNVSSTDGQLTSTASTCAHVHTHATERRVFITACSATIVAAASQWLAAQPISRSGTALTHPVTRDRQYARSILADEHGKPVRASSLKPLTNYLFHYPFVATPCLLLNLGRNIGGVGPTKSIVAFSAICSHKLAYPAKEVSFIRFQAKASSRSEAERIHCCADHSVYDPAAGAKVMAGPAPLPLAAIALEYSHLDDTLCAIGTSGTDQFDAFFTKYDFKLSMEFDGKARRPVAGNTRLQELTQFCRNVAQC